MTLSNVRGRYLSTHNILPNFSHPRNQPIPKLTKQNLQEHSLRRHYATPLYIPVSLAHILANARPHDVGNEITLPLHRKISENNGKMVQRQKNHTIVKCRDNEQDADECLTVSQRAGKPDSGAEHADESHPRDEEELFSHSLNSKQKPENPS